jgi:ppGpp synthetase/RelA/SpoT-type nucleotidyltranferase
MPTTDQSPVTGNERLLLEVVEALRGADSLRERLTTSLQTGTPAVADLAYAVTTRVKEDYKIVEKVLGKRTDRPSYGVKNVTDLVGLRVITLYRMDIVDVIDAVLDTIARDTSDTDVFVGDSISEALIYSTNPTGDAQDLPNRVKALFEGRGISAQIVERPSNYTSIHILVQGRGRYRDGYRILPIEIQVRTALEDFWGQIEHGLKYKRRKVENVRDEQRFETSLSHLGVLKTLIDGVAQYADQIKLQIDEIETGLRYGSSRSVEEPNVRLKNLKDIPDDLRDEIEVAVKAAQPVLKEGNGKPSERIRSLSQLALRLQAIDEKVVALPDLQQRTRKEASYLLTMQRALVHFQLGNLIADGESEVQRALHLYREMEKLFPKRLVITYRIARTLDALGRRVEAIDKLRALMLALSAKGEPTPKQHWIRSAAPRVLGVLLWEEAETLRGGHGSERGLAGPKALELLNEAFTVTREARETKVREDPEDRSGSTERAKASNNLLYYLLEVVEGGGSAPEGSSEADTRRYLREMGADDPSAMTDHQFADTARRAFLYLGDADNAHRAAEKVLELTGHGEGANDPHIRRAVLEARATLSDRGNTSTEEPAKD